MKVFSIGINNYTDDFSMTEYDITVYTDKGGYDGSLNVFSNDISAYDIYNRIMEICDNQDIENDPYELRNMLKEEIILKR